MKANKPTYVHKFEPSLNAIHVNQTKNSTCYNFLVSGITHSKVAVRRSMTKWAILRHVKRLSHVHQYQTLAQATLAPIRLKTLCPIPTTRAWTRLPWDKRCVSENRWRRIVLRHFISGLGMLLVMPSHTHPQQCLHRPHPSCNCRKSLRLLRHSSVIR